MKPNSKPTDSSNANSALAMLRSMRMLEVSFPWTQRDWAQRCRPASEVGPVLFPP